MTRRSAKRGTLRKDDSTFIGAWIPCELMDRIDTFVANEDLDRSKMLRRAIEEKLSKTPQEVA
jgi:metal-responsive CopG/Arc/MetJ family transcriptional regulator